MSAYNKNYAGMLRAFHEMVFFAIPRLDSFGTDGAVERTFKEGGVPYAAYAGLEGYFSVPGMCDAMSSLVKCAISPSRTKCTDALVRDYVFERIDLSREAILSPGLFLSELYKKNMTAEFPWDSSLCQRYGIPADLAEFFMRVGGIGICCLGAWSRDKEKDIDYKRVLFRVSDLIAGMIFPSIGPCIIKCGIVPDKQGGAFMEWLQYERCMDMLPPTKQQGCLMDILRAQNTRSNKHHEPLFASSEQIVEQTYCHTFFDLHSFLFLGIAQSAPFKNFFVEEQSTDNCLHMADFIVATVPIWMDIEKNYDSAYDSKGMKNNIYKTLLQETQLFWIRKTFESAQKIASGLLHTMDLQPPIAPSSSIEEYDSNQEKMQNCWRNIQLLIRAAFVSSKANFLVSDYIGCQLSEEDYYSMRDCTWLLHKCISIFFKKGEHSDLNSYVAIRWVIELGGAIQRLFTKGVIPQWPTFKGKVPLNEVAEGEGLEDICVAELERHSPDRPAPLSWGEYMVSFVVEPIPPAPLSLREYIESLTLPN